MIVAAPCGEKDVEFVHQPVMLSEVLSFAGQVGVRRIVDCTVGGAGHARALLTAHPDAELLGLDRDPEAVTAATAALSGFGNRAHVTHADFSAARAAMNARGWAAADVILADLGVSSHQLEMPGRGFSFRFDAALDMRMDPTTGESAAELIATVDERELARIIAEWGEEKRARRVAQQIVRARPTTTAALAQVVRGVVPKSKDGLDPATRTFQALRIKVNRELDELSSLLVQLPELLSDGAVAIVLSYHSLEDRAVKTEFRMQARDCICPPELPQCRCSHHSTLKILTPRPLRPTSAELATNTRAASAKLRAATRLPRPS